MLVTTADVGEFHDRAVYSDDMVYRYEYERRWGDGAAAVWVLLNPATGDTDGKPRPTLRRIVDRTRAWGLGAVLVVNIFAFRATQPRALLDAAQPIGPDTDAVLARVTAAAPTVVAAWGAHGRLLGRGRQVSAAPSRHIVPRADSDP